MKFRVRLVKTTTYEFHASNQADAKQMLAERQEDFGYSLLGAPGFHVIGSSKSYLRNIRAMKERPRELK